MSIRIMSAVWGVDLPDSDKIVLLALADCANDEGVCWPSMRALVEKCSKSDRTIQAAIKSLVDAGHLKRDERPGRGVLYTVQPRSHFAPEAISPPKPLPPEVVSPTPEAASDKPSRTIIASTEASPPTKRRASAAGAFVLPEGMDIDPQHWADLLVNRKSKRLPNTATAYARMLADLDRLSDEEWPPGKLVQFAAERGWGAIFDPRNRDTRNGTASHHNGNGYHRPGGRPSAWAPKPGMAGSEPAFLDD